MKCQECGFENAGPVLEDVPLPLDPKPENPPKLHRQPTRWACLRCDRYHFADGSLYDFEKAKEMAS